MKPPRPKPHLIDSDEPLRENTALIAGCGAEVRDAKFISWFDGRIDDFADYLATLNSLNCCAKCLRLEYEKRYFAKILDGQTYLQTLGDSAA